ncbi:SDR family NAD(P)-dependent oxidoreductase [Mycolicibacterium smegmatis]|uniref:SDR family NAD(P)-dependent oxidoreductase n=1 Tax=Mycolicibacterium smegmatis TaxID=1772 RepID=UPI001E6564D1|nr:SDR family NAD(P)-dependent oxidoreductase [Mycolicibacterium smegmatis]UGU32067.1 SDR family NAD(P)-dependent oxidoreductase [Mycolicibacterium smegmatis]ULN72949.1 SDR family NAD(P)-dependent oxidoreductase [Mycolicibacterium smegmatis]
MRIADRVFVVTGAGNGMGREVALGLARRGAHVAAVDLDEAGLAGTAERARGTGARMSTHVLNVTDRDAVAGLPDAVLDVHGQIDGLVNIAGIAQRFALFTDLEGDQIDRVTTVNFLGTVQMCRAFLPVLRQRPEANITNMSSLSALVPFASQVLYSASKAAVQQFSEGLDAELADTNVRVVTVFPGQVSTNLAQNSGVKMLDAGGRRAPVTTPEAAGRKIVTGIAKDRYRVIIGTDAHVLYTLSRLAPRRTARMVAKQIKSVL